MARSLYLIGYDIARPKRLASMLEIVKGFSTGGQKSFYECWMSQAERKRFLVSVSSVLCMDEDSLLVMRLDPRSRVRVLGIGIEPEEQSYFFQG